MKKMGGKKPGKKSHLGVCGGSEFFNPLVALAAQFFHSSINRTENYHFADMPQRLISPAFQFAIIRAMMIEPRSSAQLYNSKMITALISIGIMIRKSCFNF